jgi:DNA-binding XRE family transcriptional regulator
MQEFNELEMLKKYKEKSGWSYEKIAQNIGVHSQTIQGWFSGKYKPSQLAKKALRSFLINNL